MDIEPMNPISKQELKDLIEVVEEFNNKEGIRFSVEVCLDSDGKFVYSLQAMNIISENEWQRWVTFYSNFRIWDKKQYRAIIKEWIESNCKHRKLSRMISITPQRHEHINLWELIKSFFSNAK